MSRVGVVIPTLDGRDLLEESLPALRSASGRDGPSLEVVVVDNGSRDGTREWLARHHPEVRVLALEENEGFSSAVNRGVRALDTPFILPLNNDVVVEAGFLPPLLSALDDASVFAAAPRIVLSREGDFDEAVNWGELRGVTLEIVQPGRPDPALSGPTPVLFAVGAALLLRRAHYLELGGLDPTFEPYYYEDVDLSLRAWRRGWRVLYVPQSRVRHRHRGTIDRLHRPEEREIFKWANLELLNWKHLRGLPVAADYLAALVARARDAFVVGRRDPLLALAFAFERLSEIPPAWGRDPLASVPLEEALRRSRPVRLRDQRRESRTASS